MFEGNWSYGDPRDQQTVGERRQKKEKTQRWEGSIHTNSSEDTTPSIHRSLTPSGFFAGGSKRQNALRLEKQASMARLQSPARANNGAKDKAYGALVCKSDQMVATSPLTSERMTLSLPKGSETFPKLITAASPKHNIALSPKAKSVLSSVFGKRLRHERKPSINEIIPMGAFENRPKILNNASIHQGLQSSNSSNAMVKVKETKANSSQKFGENAYSNGQPNQPADGNNSNGLKILSPINKSASPSSALLEPSLDSFPMPRMNSKTGKSTVLFPSGNEQSRNQPAPPAPPPSVPVPPTPDSKAHKRSLECGSFSDGSTLVTPNRRSDIPSERADSPTPRRSAPEDLPLNSTVFPTFDKLKMEDRNAVPEDMYGTKHFHGLSPTHNEDRNRNHYFGSPQRGGSRRIKPMGQGKHYNNDQDEFINPETRSRSPPTYLNYGGPSKNTNLPLHLQDDTTERTYTGSNKLKDRDAMPVNSYRISYSGNKNVRERAFGFSNDTYGDEYADMQAPGHVQTPRPSSRTAGNIKKQISETSLASPASPTSPTSPASPLTRKSFAYHLNRMENAGLKIAFKRLMEDWSIDPTAPIDEQNEMMADIAFEKKIWALIGTRWLTFGRLLVSPAQKLLAGAKIDDGLRMLSLQGSAADGWVLAANFPNVAVYSFSAQDIFQPNCSWTPPINHHSVFDARIETKLPFVDAYFDVIVSKTVTSLWSDSMWEMMLRECHRVLRPGGWLEIQTMEPVLQGQGDQLKRWTDSKLLVELMDEEMSITPANDLKEFLPQMGFSEVKSSRVQLHSVIKRTHRGNSPATQREVDANKLSVFVGRHIYEELYGGFLPKSRETGYPERFWWQTNRQVKNECEVRDATFDLGNVFAQKP